MPNDISLTAGMRNNLLALQNTNNLITQTQGRLSSGKKVNSALDNPTNFFAAQANQNRSADLTNRKDGMSQSIQMVQAANSGITAITSLIQSAQGIAGSALATTSATDRLSFATTFDSLMSQVSQLASDSGYGGTNLLANASKIVEFAPATGSATLQIQGFDSTSSGLGISNAIGVGGSSITTRNITIVAPTNVANSMAFDLHSFFSAPDLSYLDSSTGPWPDCAYRLVDVGTGGTAGTASLIHGSVFPGLEGYTAVGVINSGTSYKLQYSADGFSNMGVANNPATVTDNIPMGSTTPGGNSWDATSGIQSSASQLESALTTLRTQSSNLSANLSVVTTRQSFTDSMVNVLNTGADNLTLADMNQEGANMLMLQTRQSLGTSSLSMASQAAQSVLKLF